MAKRSQKSITRSATPSVNTMGVREFTRGGLYDIEQPTTITSNNEEIGTWLPRGTVGAGYYVSNNTPTFDVNSNPLSPNFTGVVMSASTTPPTSEVVSSLTEAVTKLHEYLSQQDTDKEDK